MGAHLFSALYYSNCIPYALMLHKVLIDKTKPHAGYSNSWVHAPYGLVCACDYLVGCRSAFNINYPCMYT